MKLLDKLLVLQNLYRLQALGYSYGETVDFSKLPRTSMAASLEALHEQIHSCHLCDLKKSCSRSLCGYGNPNADIFVVDYTVSKIQHDTQEYFAGKSGEMLRKMIENVLHVKPESIYLTHTLKCKPPQINMELKTAVDTCKMYLYSQLDFIKPKIIVTLGERAYEALSGETNFNEVRGHLTDFHGTKLIPIYHPQYLVQNPALKKTAQQDLLTIKNYLDSL